MAALTLPWIGPFGAVGASAPEVCLPGIGTGCAFDVHGYVTDALGNAAPGVVVTDGVRQAVTAWDGSYDMFEQTPNRREITAGVSDACIATAESKFQVRSFPEGGSGTDLQLPCTLPGAFSLGFGTYTFSDFSALSSTCAYNSPVVGVPVGCWRAPYPRLAAYARPAASASNDGQVAGAAEASGAFLVDWESAQAEASAGALLATATGVQSATFDATYQLTALNASVGRQPGSALVDVGYSVTFNGPSVYCSDGSAPAISTLGTGAGEISDWNTGQLVPTGSVAPGSYEYRQTFACRAGAYLPEELWAARMTDGAYVQSGGPDLAGSIAARLLSIVVTTSGSQPTLSGTVTTAYSGYDASSYGCTEYDGPLSTSSSCGNTNPLCGAVIDSVCHGSAMQSTDGTGQYYLDDSAYGGTAGNPVASGSYEHFSISANPGAPFSRWDLALDFTIASFDVASAGGNPVTGVPYTYATVALQWGSGDPMRCSDGRPASTPPLFQWFDHAGRYKVDLIIECRGTNSWVNVPDGVNVDLSAVGDVITGAQDEYAHVRIAGTLNSAAATTTYA